MNQHKSVWCRVLAVFLAVALALIPVSFPGSANAAAEDLASTLVNDGFSAGTGNWSTGLEAASSHDVTYQWNDTTNESTAFALSTVKKEDSNGAYNVFANDTSYRFAYLDMTENGEDAAGLWTDYTVSMDVSQDMLRTGTNSNGTYLFLLARVQKHAQGGYQAYFLNISRSNTLNVGKLWYGTVSSKTRYQVSLSTGSQITGLSIPANAVAHVTLTVEGTETPTVTARISYTDADGNPVGEGRLATWTDTGTECGEVLTHGSIGFGAAGRKPDADPANPDKNVPMNATFDNIQVTLPNKSVIFTEDFSDMSCFTSVNEAGSKAGSFVIPAKNAPVPVDVTYKWSLDSTMNKGDSVTAQGGYRVNYASGSNLYTPLTLTDDSANDLSALWTDYTVEADIENDFSTNTATSPGYGGMLLGRIVTKRLLSYNTTETYTGTSTFYDGYFVWVTGRSISLRRLAPVISQAAGNGGYRQGVVELNSVNYQTVDAATDYKAIGKKLHISLTFSGKDITVAWSFPNGEIEGGSYTVTDNQEKTWNDNTHAPSGVTIPADHPGYGSVGIGLYPSTATSPTPRCAVTFDNLAVTLAGETDPVFTEDWTLDEGVTVDDYMAASRKEANNMTLPSWKTYGDSLHVQALHNSPLFALSSGSAAWKNYAVTAAAALDVPGASIGLIAHASDAGYYELRLTETGLKLYSVNADGADTVLAETTGVTYNLYQTYALKLKTSEDGSAIKAYVDNAEVLSVSAVAADHVHAAGTAGVSAEKVATFDNFHAYNELSANCKTVSLTLEGNIGVNFFFSLSEEVAEDSSTYFRVTLPNGTYEDIKVENAATGTPKGKSGTYYKITGAVAAKEMAEDVTVQVYYKDAVILTRAYSVKAYADANLEAQDAELVALLKAMLNYGAAAQVQFNHNEENLANSALAEGDKALAEVAGDLYAPTKTGSVEGFAYKETSCLLESETTVRHYFTVEGDLIDYTVTVDGEAAKIVADGDRYYIAVENIAAQDLDDAHVLVITKGEGNLTVSFAVQSYMKAALAQSQDAELRNVIKAMHQYNMAADTYFAPEA